MSSLRMPDLVLDSPKFQIWKQRVESNGNVIKDIKVVGVIARDTKSYYGAFLDCLLQTPEGTQINRCVLISGDSVVIVPLLTCLEDGELYTIMVEQRRIVDGDYAMEFPAGGLDELQHDHRAAACQEIQEELDWTIAPEELIPLASEPVDVVPNILDGRMHYFYFQRTVPRSFLQAMDGLHTGCHKEQEYLTIKVCNMAEAAKVTKPSTLIGMKLLERKLNRVF